MLSSAPEALVNPVPVLKVSRILNTFVKTDTGYIKSYNTESDISRNSDTRVIYYII